MSIFETTRQVKNPDLAAYIAHAEKPYIEMAMETGKSEAQRRLLGELALTAGSEAAKEYMHQIQDDILRYTSHTNSESVPLQEKVSSELYDKVTTSIDELKFGETVKARITNLLKRRGVHTVLDLLVRGKSSIGDIPYIGEGSLTDIEEQLTQFLGGQVEWKDEPTVHDIAMFYDDLSQVPMDAVYMGNLLSSARIQNGRVWQYTHRKRVYSVAELMVLPIDEYARSLGIEEILDSDRVHLTHIQNKVRKFADEFHQIKSTDNTYV